MSDPREGAAVKARGYRAQDACVNCKHRIATWEHDESTRLYCGKDAPPRPPCGSVGMDESIVMLPHGQKGPDGTCFRPDDEVDAMDKAWDDWATPREVEYHGICDAYEREPER